MYTFVKLLLAILLLLCLNDFPYSYYQFVRFAAMVGFAFLAVKANEKQRSNEVFVFIALALLFQPFYKIALGRMIWNVVDVIVAIGLILTIFTDKEKPIRS